MVSAEVMGLAELRINGVNLAWSRSHRFVTASRQLCHAELCSLLAVLQAITDAEAKMTHVHATVLRLAHHLQYFYYYLTPCARRAHHAGGFRATAHLKRSFVG
jgi:hypothetical protein